MMKDVVKKGTGTKARFKKSKMPISGKTGTTNDTKDLTFVGYTPYYAAGIWLGYDKPKTMREDHGYHLKLWSSIMEEIHSSLEYKDFIKPSGLTSVSICKKTGLLASSMCKSSGTAVTENFIANTQPKKYCSSHAQKNIENIDDKNKNKTDNGQEIQTESKEPNTEKTADKSKSEPAATIDNSNSNIPAEPVMPD